MTYLAHKSPEYSKSNGPIIVGIRLKSLTTL